MPPQRTKKTRSVRPVRAPRSARTRRAKPRRPGRPPRASAGSDDPDRVRDRLLEAATELAAAQGFETCGLREIAARADVSPAMVAYYFGDRQGLGEALVARVFERAGERVRTFVESRERDRETGVDELVQLYVATLTADPWLPKLIASELLAHGASPLRSRLLRDLTRGPLMTMVRWLEEEQRAERLRADVDARWLAISVASLCAFPFLIVPIVGEELGLPFDARFAEELVAHTRQLLAHGIRARSEVLP